jgi:anti-sigma-K factor RskA
MTSHDWYLENRVAFVTRTLTADEASAFADHVSRCDECRGAVAEIERDLAWLPMGVTPLAPRPGLVHALTEQALRPRRPRLWPWVASLATAASLVLAVHGWASGRQEISFLKSALAAHQGRLAAAEDSLSAIVGAERVLQAAITAPGYHGGFLIFYDQDTERWNVVVHDLPPTRAGETYQLWLVSGRGLLPGPELLLSGARPTFVTLPAPGPSSDVIGAVLAVGPAGSTPGSRRGVELARLTF